MRRLHRHSRRRATEVDRRKASDVHRCLGGDRCEEQRPGRPVHAGSEGDPHGRRPDGGAAVRRCALLRLLLFALLPLHEASAGPGSVRAVLDGLVLRKRVPRCSLGGVPPLRVPLPGAAAKELVRPHRSSRDASRPRDGAGETCGVPRRAPRTGPAGSVESRTERRRPIPDELRQRLSADDEREDARGFRRLRLRRHRHLPDEDPARLRQSGRRE